MSPPTLLQRGGVALLFGVAFVVAYLAVPVNPYLGGREGLQLRPEVLLLPIALLLGPLAVLGTAGGVLAHNLLFRLVPGGITPLFAAVQTGVVLGAGLAALIVRRVVPPPYRNVVATWTLSLPLIVVLGVVAAQEYGTTLEAEAIHIFREVLLPINILGLGILEVWDLRRTLPRRARGRSLRPRPLVRLGLLPLLGIALLVMIPSHAVARCFGEPEPVEEEAMWSLGLRAETHAGLWDLAYLGVDERATTGFDPDLDAVEPLFEGGRDPENDTIALFAYFHYPENAESPEGNPSFVALTRSVIPPAGNLTWPLRVAYFFPGEALLTLYWSPQVVGESGYDLTLLTPFGDEVSMGDVSEYTFQAIPGFYDFTVRALPLPAPLLTGETLILVAIVAGYAGGLVAFLWLRRRWRGRGGLPPSGGP